MDMFLQLHAHTPPHTHTHTHTHTIGNQPPPPVQSATSSASSLPAINTDAQNSVEPPQTAIPSSLIGDLSLLDSTALQTDASKEKGLLALTMYEKPLGSARVPSEYTEFPVAPEWESKVLKYIRVSYRGRGIPGFPSTLYNDDIVIEFVWY